MPPSTISNEFAAFLMDCALNEARKGFQEGEVPIGAVLSMNGQIISSAHNQIEQSNDATAHAEILVIREASKKLNNWRLTDAILCATLEPCTMCVGAIKLSRIPTVIFGAGDSRFGAMGSTRDLSGEDKVGPAINIIKGIKAEECSQLLKDFFALRRNL